MSGVMRGSQTSIDEVAIGLRRTEEETRNVWQDAARRRLDDRVMRPLNDELTTFRRSIDMADAELGAAMRLLDS